MNLIALILMWLVVPMMLVPAMSAKAEEAAPKGINFQAQLVDPSTGDPLRECGDFDPGPPPKCKREFPVTLGRLALGSLLQPEQNLDATEQLKRWTLAQKVFKAVYPVELSADEIELIKKQIAKRGHPEWTGQAVELLDPVAARKAK